MTLLADVVVLHKLTTVRRSYPLLDFAQKLLLVAQHALYRFHDQSFTVAPLFHSSARQLLLQRRIESYFHAARLRLAHPLSTPEFSPTPSIHAASVSPSGMGG